MPPFYVIGHKNPDTDAICSAIGYAALLRAVGEEPNAIAARCGEISQRTKWVLERADLDAPMLLTDVRVNSGMICHRKVIKVGLADTASERPRDRRRAAGSAGTTVPLWYSENSSCR